MRETSKESGRPIFENEDICLHTLEPYLHSIGADPLGQRPLPKIEDLVPIPDLKERIQEFLFAQHYNGEQKVFFKSPLIALVWPLFQQAFPDAQWVIVRRSDADVVYSCMHTGFMTGYKSKRGWQGWLNRYKQRFAGIHYGGVRVGEIWPTTFVEGDFSEIQACVAWLGLGWNDEAVRNFICPELFHRKETDNGS